MANGFDDSGLLSSLGLGYLSGQSSSFNMTDPQQLAAQLQSESASSGEGGISSGTAATDAQSIMNAYIAQQAAAGGGAAAGGTAATDTGASAPATGLLSYGAGGGGGTQSLGSGSASLAGQPNYNNVPLYTGGGGGTVTSTFGSPAAAYQIANTGNINQAVQAGQQYIQGGASAANTALQNAYQTGMAGLSPYATTGGNASSALGNLLGLNGAANQQQAFQGVQSSPQYQFAQNYGQQQLAANFSQNGLLYTGGFGQGLSNYGTQLANTMIGNQVGYLQGLTGTGQTAAGQGALLSGTYGSNVAGVATGTAAAQANLSLGQATALNAQNTQAQQAANTNSLLGQLSVTK